MSADPVPDSPYTQLEDEIGGELAYALDNRQIQTYIQDPYVTTRLGRLILIHAIENSRVPWLHHCASSEYGTVKRMYLDACEFWVTGMP